MIRINPTKISLKSDDLKEYEQVKGEWIETQKNTKKKNDDGNNVNNNNNNTNFKKAATRQRIGLFEG
jgi:ribonuclease HI